MSRDRPPPADAVSSPPPSSTPSRLRNNYADEAAPIASAKRPTRRHKPATPMDITPRAAAREDEWSPMHRVRAVPRNSHATAAVDLNDELAGEQSAPLEPPEDVGQDSWVGRKVDALFSPVLSFLNGDGSADPAASEDTVSSVRGAFDDHATGNDEEGRTAAVSIAIRAALLEASKELEPDDIITTDSNLDCKDSATDDEGFDAVPVMTKTDSTNGDLVMTRGTGRSTDSRYHDGPSDNHCIHDDDDDSDYKGHTQLHQEYEEDVDEEEEFNPFLFIKSLPPYQYAVPPGWIMRSKALPPPSHDDPPICLVLDLDETLVHCTVEPIRNADMVFPVEFNGVEYTVHVRCRPFLTDFLEKVSRDFEVVVFTASQQVYADKLLDKIDPDGKYIRHRMFRDSCLPVEGNFLKDLTVLGRDLRRTVLVDNSPHAFGYQVDNGIPIESWFDDPMDRELLKLERFLRTLHGKEDVRDVVREKFQTFKLILDA